MSQGQGWRIHSIEQAASLLHLAEELVADGSKLPLSIAQMEELSNRVQRIRALANGHMDEVAEYDRRHRGVTEGEAASGVKILP